MESIVLGITGCMGSGKSTASRIVERFWRATVIDVDAVARAVAVEKAEELKKALKITAEGRDYSRALARGPSSTARSPTRG